MMRACVRKERKSVMRLSSPKVVVIRWKMSADTQNDTTEVRDLIQAVERLEGW